MTTTQMWLALAAGVLILAAAVGFWRHVNARIAAAQAVDVVAEQMWTEADDELLAKHAAWYRYERENLRMFGDDQ